MSARFAYKVISLLVLLSLTLQPIAVAGKQVDKETSRQGIAAPTTAGLFRTTVTVDNPSRRARLDALGVIVLSGGAAAREQGSGGAEVSSPAPLPPSAPAQIVVLADAAQLEALARLRFEPRATDDADALVAAHAQGHPALAAAWGELRQRMGTNKRMRADKRMGSG